MFDYSTQDGTIRAYGVIGDYEDGISELDFMDAFDALGGDDVTIHLQSEGGSVTSGLSIYNQIEAYPGRVQVQIDAIAASIASVFPMAADRVVANRNSIIMIHDPWTVAVGNAAEFRGLADVLDTLADGIADSYAQRTGRANAYWRDVMRKEQYFNAEQALELGLVDAIAESGQETAAAARREPVATVSPSFAALRGKVAAHRLKVRRACAR